MSDKNTYKSAKPDKFYYICNSINELTHQNCIIMLGCLGYLFICFGVKDAIPGVKVSMIWLTGLYFIHTMGELSLIHI